MENNDLKLQVDALEKQVKELTDLVMKGNFSDRQVFDRNVELKNGVKIGSRSTSLVGFFGVTPVVRQNSITPPSGGTTQDTQARTAINSMITALKNIGITS